MTTGKNKIGSLALIYVLTFTVLRSAAVEGAILDGPIVDPANGHFYYLLAPSNWVSAEAQAVALGGNLATIRNPSEQAFVFNTFGTVNGTNYSLWIGLYDPSGVAHDDGPGGPGSQHARNFVWVDGEPVTYTNWYATQPDDGQNHEYYVHMIDTGNGFGVTPGTWNDMDLNESYSQFAPYAGVVEVVPEPASLLILAIASMNLIARRRQTQPSAAGPMERGRRGRAKSC